MDVRILSRRVGRMAKCTYEGVTPQEWAVAFAEYPARARHHVANLAAHGWCVALMDGRCLVACLGDPDGNSHWVSKDGSIEDSTPEENAAFAEALRRIEAAKEASRG